MSSVQFTSDKFNFYSKAKWILYNLLQPNFFGKHCYEAGHASEPYFDQRLTVRVSLIIRKWQHLRKLLKHVMVGPWCEDSRGVSRVILCLFLCSILSTFEVSFRATRESVSVMCACVASSAMWQVCGAWAGVCLAQKTCVATSEMVETLSSVGGPKSMLLFEAKCSFSIPPRHQWDS